MLAVLTGGCGPTRFPVGNGSSGGWLTNGLPSEGVDPSGGETWGLPASSSGTTGDGLDSADGVGQEATSSTEADTGEVDWLFGPGDTASQLLCNADDTMRLVLETYPEGSPVACENSPDAGVDDLLDFVIRQWDGTSGTHLVHQDANTFGIFGGEFLVGSIELTVSAPFIVDRVFIEVGNEQATFVGYAELATCAMVRPPSCVGA